MLQKEVDKRYEAQEKEKKDDNAPMNAPVHEPDYNAPDEFL